MKALSLWQPWASLWCSTRKRHETRSWPLKQRGWLAVHAAKKDICSAIDKTFGAHDDERQEFIKLAVEEYGKNFFMDLPRGCVVGAVHVVDCVETFKIWDKIIKRGTRDRETLDDLTCGNFSKGRFGFLRDEFRLLPQPVPFIGRQGVFDVPDDIFSGLLELPPK